jgi:hypothetical protein
MITPAIAEIVAQSSTRRDPEYRHLLTCIKMRHPTGGQKKRGCLMLRRHRKLSAAIAVTGTLLSMLAFGPATIASASPAWTTHVCRGTPRSPGRLAGVYWDVVVRGVCVVNHGPAFVQHDLIVAHNGALIAAFGRWHSRLSVGHDIFVNSGGTAILGCEAAHFACLDDPHPKRPSLRSHDTVGGDLLARGALGIVVHNSWFGHNIVDVGGGGGVSCKPMGVFTVFKSPAYTDYEDNWVGGSIWVQRIHSCWLGALRNWIGWSATVSSNKMADPDAMEVLTNVVRKDLTCWRNTPAVQYGDSHGMPNRVGLHAFFQCGFHVLKPNPAGQHRHFEHISVHLH